MKAPLRKAAERIIEERWSAIGRRVDAVSPDVLRSPLAQAVEHLAQAVPALPRIRAQPRQIRGDQRPFPIGNLGRMIGA